MGVALPSQKLVEAFAASAPTGNVPGGKTAPFPVASQVSAGFPGRASLNDGFTPANMTPLAASGIPMSGPDTNGALFLISAPVACLTAGQVFYVFDGTYATAISGYAKGARLADATDATMFWTSLVASNSIDPATSNQVNWFASRPLYSLSAPAAGTHADNTLPGASDFFLDINTAAGNVLLNGFVALRDGQRLIISNTGSNALQLGVAAGTAGNQLRANAGPLTIAPNDSMTIQYCKSASAGVGVWVVV